MNTKKRTIAITAAAVTALSLATAGAAAAHPGGPGRPDSGQQGGGFSTDVMPKGPHHGPDSVSSADRIPMAPPAVPNASDTAVEHANENSAVASSTEREALNAALQDVKAARDAEVDAAKAVFATDTASDLATMKASLASAASRVQRNAARTIYAINTIEERAVLDAAVAKANATARLGADDAWNTYDEATKTAEVAAANAGYRQDVTDARDAYDQDVLTARATFNTATATANADLLTALAAATTDDERTAALNTWKTAIAPAKADLRTALEDAKVAQKDAIDTAFETWNPTLERGGNGRGHGHGNGRR